VPAVSDAAAGGETAWTTSHSTALGATAGRWPRGAWSTSQADPRRPRMGR